MALNYASELESLIDTVITEGGSDLHLSAHSHPIIRVSGALIPLLKKPEYTPEDTRGILTELIGKEKVTAFEVSKEFDFSYQYKDKVRFRGNCFVQQGTISIALRLIPRDIKTLAELSLPPILETFCEMQQGFFLVVGPVGQGKSTTLASMIEKINQERTEHIVTIEDPIEFRFEPGKSLIEQREVGIDTKDFSSALNHIFRQDADVIMIGEMRDKETIATAVTAAETGHLVLSTLHANSASQTVDRIIDSFPSEQQDQIRLQLASSLIGIFSQRLVPRISGGLIPAFELLVNTQAVANLIRERRTHEIDVMIETGMQEGMIDLDRNLADLVRAGEVTKDDAQVFARKQGMFQRLI